MNCLTGTQRPPSCLSEKVYWRGAGKIPRRRSLRANPSYLDRTWKILGRWQARWLVRAVPFKSIRQRNCAGRWPICWPIPRSGRKWWQTRARSWKRIEEQPRAPQPWLPILSKPLEERLQVALSPTNGILGGFVTLSSRGLGHRPFTAVTRVRIPLGSPFDSACYI